jgi:hypothetical protein
MGVITSFVMGLAVLGQAPSADAAQPGSTARDEALATFQKEAARYVLTPQGSEGKLEFVAEPVLNWGNPARNNEDGAVFVWLRGGRPAAIGSIFTYLHGPTGRVVTKHAFHSLSDQPLTATYENQLVWSPQAAGLRFAALEAEAPADSSRRRLVQMRALAREFSATMIDLKGETTELRLLSQPIYRYEPKKGEVKDGAIFAFAVGTDPEALLIIEARAKGDDLHWEYAFARFHFVELVASYQGKEVWRAEAEPDMARAKFGDAAFRNDIYLSVARP